jgi:peptidoglycan/LPS O-acetylase OafA/YrhL
MSQNTTPKRVPELDAIRGLAALTVVVFHYFLLLKGASVAALAHAYQWTHLLAMTPLGLFWAGHQAVVLFFILSGFVLTLMLESGRLGYFAYLSKRVVRLYLPYAAAVAIGVLFAFALHISDMGVLGSWINKFWSWHITAPSVAQHAAVLGEFNADRYDFTIWSLVHEIRISLVFPLLLLLVWRTRWWVSLALLMLLSAVMITLRYGAFHGWGSPFGVFNHAGLTNYTLTFHYLLAFGIGALLAKHRLAIKNAYQRLSNKRRIILVLAAFALYLDGGHFARWLGPDMMVIGDWPVMAGAAGLLVAAAFSGRASAWLLCRPFRWLGRISYSLYLFHPLVLLALLHIFYGHVPLPLLLTLAFLATFPLTALAWWLFEKPAVALSRRIAPAPRSGKRASSAYTGDRHDSHAS